MNESTLNGDFERYDERLHELLDEFSRRLSSGESLSMEDFAACHPDHTEALRDLLPAVGVLQELRSDRLLEDAPTPKALGDFRIIRLIGQGGMGLVYEAEQMSLGRRVAVKVLPFAGMLSTNQLQRFRNEAHATASLHHPHIVNAFFFGQERGVHFYAMRLIEGESLASLIRDRKNVNSGVEKQADTEPVAGISTMGSRNRHEFHRGVARVGIDVAQALAHAHSMSIIHRDVKPSNIMIDRDGHTWVTDFGLASTLADSDLTLTGDVLGTLRYMSPEQAAGNQSVDQRSDVYSLGATLYELLAGRPALDGSTQAELVKQLDSVNPPRLRTLDSRIPPDLENIVLKAICKLPADRYNSATELATDLQRYLAHKPVRARRLTRRQRLIRWARLNRAFATLLAIVATLLLVLAVAGPLIAVRQTVALRSITRTSHAQHTRRAFEAWNRGHVDQVPDLLEIHDDDAYAVSLRGFAWQYLWNRCRRLDETPSYAHGLTGCRFAISPDGQRFAVFGVRDGVGRLQFCDTKQMTPLKEVETVAILNGAYTPSGNSFLAVCEDDTLRGWDADSFQELFSRKIDPLTAGEIAIAPVGDRIALFQNLGPRVDIWTLKAIRSRPGGRPELSLDHEYDHVRSVDFTADGERIASCSHFGLTKVWSIVDGPETLLDFRIEGNTEIPDICFHPSRDILATSGTGLRLWDASTGVLLAWLGDNSRNVNSLAFTADGTRLLAGGERQVEVWDVDRRTQIETLYGASSDCSDVRCANGTILASFGSAKAIRRWSVPNQTVDNTSATFVEFVGESSDVLAITSSAYRLGRQGQGAFRLWDIPKRMERYAGRPGRYGMASLSPVDPHGIAVPLNKTIHVMDVRTPERPLILKGQSSSTTCTTFSPNGKLLAAASFTIEETPELMLWDLAATLPAPTRLKLPGGFGPARIEFSPDGKILVVAGGSWSEGSVILYDVTTGARIDSGALVSEKQGPFAGLCFSSDGTCIATGGYNRHIILIDWKQGQLKRQVQAHGNSAISSLVFSPDGQRIVAGFLSGHVGIWDVDTGEQVAELDARSPVYDVAFSANGDVLAAGCANGAAVVWFEDGTKQSIDSLK